MATVVEEKEVGGRRRALGILVGVLILVLVGLGVKLLRSNGQEGEADSGEEGLETISILGEEGHPSAGGEEPAGETAPPAEEGTRPPDGGETTEPSPTDGTAEVEDGTREMDDLLGVSGTGAQGTGSPGASTSASPSGTDTRGASRYGTSDRPILTPQERREREEKRRYIGGRWDEISDLLVEGLTGWADSQAWSKEACKAAEGAALEHLETRRREISEEILLEMDRHGIDATLDAVQDSALAQGQAQGRRQADSRGIVWNSWVDDPFAAGTEALAPEEVVPDRRYSLLLDLAPLAYRHLGDWPGLEDSTPDGRLLDALEKARGRRSLEIDVRPWALGRTVRLVDPQTQKVSIDLDRLFAENGRAAQLLQRAEPPTLEEVSEALRGAQIEIPFEVEGYGCGAVALSITQADHFRPLDHLVRRIPVQKPGGEPLDCGADQLDAESFAAGLRSVLLHRAAPRVDGALHLFDIKDGSWTNTIVYWINGKQGGEYYAWNAGGGLQGQLADSAFLGKQVAEIETNAEDNTDFQELKGADDGDRRLASPDYTSLAGMLADLLFTGKSGEDRSQARAARDDLTRMVEAQKAPPTIIVRKVNVHHEVELVPLHLLGAPGEGRLFAKPVHLIFPLEREDYTSEPACIEELTIAVPPFLDRETFQTPVEDLVSSRRWLHGDDKASMKILESHLLGTAMEAGEEAAEEPEVGEALVLAAHHEGGRLWYSDRDPPAERYFVNHDAIRTFGRGSLAVLAICTAASPRPEDSWLARTLNTKKIETLILSPFPVNVDYGKAFAIHFGLETEAARKNRETPTVLELFEKAARGAEISLRKALGQEWSAGHHVFLVAGNHELRLCPPKEEVNDE